MLQTSPYYSIFILQITKMWFELCLAAVLLLYYILWIIKWRNPKCNGVLPPGSMGLPLLGETLQLLTPSYSLDIHAFIKNKIQKFGPIFKTSVVGRPIVVSADPEFNNYIFQQEMKSVDMWYLDTFSKVFDLEGEGKVHTIHSVHKYIRSLVLSYIGVDNIKQTLLPHLEDMVHKTLHNWSSQESVEVRSSTSEMIFNFTSKLLFSYDDIDKAQDDKLGEMLARFFDGFLSFPVNIPGTAYHKCLKEGKKAFSIIQKLVQDRRRQQNLSEKPRDLLDQALKDMTTNEFLTENVVVYILLGITVGAIESLSSAITVAVKLISEHPPVLEQLIAENEAIIKNRDKSCTSLTWDEYRSSMAFTSQVMNESLRFGNVVPGLLRKTSKDIKVKGYTIPAGWIIMIVTSALHMNPETYQDPLSFNPWRWKDLDSHIISKNFRPFGGGVRRCVGEEYGKVFLAIFLHVLVTNYRWTKHEAEHVARAPILKFGDGIHIKLWKKD